MLFYTSGIESSTTSVTKISRQPRCSRDTACAAGEGAAVDSMGVVPFAFRRRPQATLQQFETVCHSVSAPVGCLAHALHRPPCCPHHHPSRPPSSPLCLAWQALAALRLPRCGPFTNPSLNQIKSSEDIHRCASPHVVPELLPTGLHQGYGPCTNASRHAKIRSAQTPPSAPDFSSHSLTLLSDSPFTIYQTVSFA